MGVRMESEHNTSEIVSDYYNYVMRSYLGTLSLPMSDDIQKFIPLIKTEKSLTKKIILFYVLLVINYNNKYRLQKKNAKTQAIESKFGENGKKSKVIVSKVDKMDSIPDWYNDKSVASLLALWIFRLSDLKNPEYIKYGLYQILKVKSDPWNSLDKIIKIEKCDISAEDLKISYDESLNGVVKTLIKLSEYCKDSHLSKLAYSIDKNCYKQYCYEIENNWEVHNFKTIYPFYPLREEVIKFSVGKIEQSNERDTLTKQFEYNPKEIISQLLKKLELIDNQSKVVKNKQKSQLFDENVVYEFYKHDKKFYEDIKQQPMVINGVIYYVQTLKKCLFDVTSKTENGVDYILSDLSWSERVDKYKDIIDLVPVPLKTDSGDVLNKFQDSCHLTVEYKTVDGYVRKNITIAKKTNKSLIKNERIS